MWLINGLSGGWTVTNSSDNEKDGEPSSISVKDRISGLLSKFYRGISSDDSILQSDLVAVQDAFNNNNFETVTVGGDVYEPVIMSVGDELFRLPCEKQKALAAKGRQQIVRARCATRENRCVDFRLKASEKEVLFPPLLLNEIDQAMKNITFLNKDKMQVVGQNKSIGKKEFFEEKLNQKVVLRCANDKYYVVPEISYTITKMKVNGTLYDLDQEGQVEACQNAIKESGQKRLQVVDIRLHFYRYSSLSKNEFESVSLFANTETSSDEVLSVDMVVLSKEGLWYPNKQPAAPTSSKVRQVESPLEMKIVIENQPTPQLPKVAPPVSFVAPPPLIKGMNNKEVRILVPQSNCPPPLKSVVKVKKPVEPPPVPPVEVKVEPEPKVEAAIIEEPPKQPVVPMVVIEPPVVSQTPVMSVMPVKQDAWGHVYQALWKKKRFLSVVMWVVTIALAFLPMLGVWTGVKIRERWCVTK